MAVSFASTTSVSAVSVADLTVALPTHQADDILVVTVVGWVPNTTSGTDTLSAPSGWTKAISETVINTTIDGEWALFWKRATSSSETNPTFTRPATWDSGTDTCFAGRAYRFRNVVKTGDPWDDIDKSVIYTATNGTWPAVTAAASSPGRLGVSFFLSADDADQGGIDPTGWSSSSTSAGGFVSTTIGTDARFGMWYTSDETAWSSTATTNALAPAQGGYIFFVAVFNPTQVTGVADGSFSFAGPAAGTPGVLGIATGSFALSGPVVKEDIVGRLTTESTVSPNYVGVVPAAPFSATHQVIDGTTSLISGSGTLLTGDYGFRGLYSFNTSAALPRDFQNDAVGYVTLASFGDFVFKIRREVLNTYELVAEFVTASSQPTSASTYLIIDDDTPYVVGLAVLRDSTTGTISLWLSEDRWDSWVEFPSIESTVVTGALPDSVGESISALAGDLEDGPWISAFRLQWSATDLITGFDSNEIAAWNYGSNIVTGLGGDFYDSIDVAVKSLVDRKANSSYVYSMRCEATYASKTLQTDFTINAATDQSGDAPAGTNSAFVYDFEQQLEQGPADTTTFSPVAFAAVAMLNIANFRVGDGTNRNTFGTYSFDGQRPRYRIQLVDNAGVVSHVLENAALSEITWSLNEAESFSFSLPVYDALNNEITIPDQEIQVWRGDDLLVWGVPVRSSVSMTDVQYQCKGLGWFFTKRVIGRQAQNYLSNPSFETGNPNYRWVWDGWGNFWAAAETGPLGPPDFVSNITTDKSLTGFPGRSLYQYGSENTVFGPRANQYEVSTVDPNTDPEGIEWTVSAWCYIPSAQFIRERTAAYTTNGDTAPLGLVIQRVSIWEDWETNPLASPLGPSGKVYETKIASITDDSPKDRWFRLETSLIQPVNPTGKPQEIRVLLMCPFGAVYWDEVRLVRNERLRFAETDQVQIVHSLIQHAQDPAYGKTNLNIGVAGSMSGVNRTRIYDFFNHQLVSDAVNEFTDLWKGVDWSIVTTPTTRTFTTHYPMKGIRRPMFPLILGKNIASIAIPTDGEQIANRVIVLADTGASGQSREKAYATDTSGFDSGVVLEYVHNAVKESGIETLDDQAERALRQFRVPVIIPTLTTYENVGGELLGNVSVGDVVNVQAQIGAISLDGEYRIVEMRLDPETENMQVTVNPFEEWNDPTRSWGVIT